LLQKQRQQWRQQQFQLYTEQQEALEDSVSGSQPSLPFKARVGYLDAAAGALSFRLHDVRFAEHVFLCLLKYV
jgi:hypothetical protein